MVAPVTLRQHIFLIDALGGSIAAGCSDEPVADDFVPLARLWTAKLPIHSVESWYYYRD
jgi:hypothetical protein